MNGFQITGMKITSPAPAKKVVPARSMKPVSKPAPKINQKK